MGKFTPDIAISVPDKDEAAAFYSDVFGLAVSSKHDKWVELDAGPFRFYLTEEEPITSAMFAYSTEDVEGTVAKVVATGGAIIKRTESEVYVRDKFGVPICIEAQT